MKEVIEFTDGPVKAYRFGNNILGYPKLYSHVYVVDGLLIDTGHRRMGKYILEKIRNLQLDQILLTHHHEDHSGNVNELRNQFKCPVYASQKCIDLMKQRRKISFAQWIYWGSAPSCDKLLPLGNKISTPNYNFEVIPVFGHSQDMIVLYEPDKQWLFSADLFINSYIGYFMRHENIYLQIDSIKKVLELEFEFLYCSHHKRFKLPKVRLIQKLDFFEKFRDTVLELKGQGLSAAKILKRLEHNENWFTRMLSHGQLSAFNMVRSVLRE